jgi:hypothetical protein
MGANLMLTEFLEKAAAIGCNEIEIEYKDRKEWITGFRGSVGWGIGCLDSDKAKAIFKDMEELKRRKEVTMGGTQYQLAFSRYESFGEWVYRIQMKEMQKKERERPSASCQRPNPRRA